MYDPNDMKTLDYNINIYQGRVAEEPYVRGALIVGGLALGGLSVEVELGAAGASLISSAGRFTGAASFVAGLLAPGLNVTSQEALDALRAQKASVACHQAQGGGG